MKKIFQIKQEKKTPERQIEAIKNEIRKYIKRERNKALPKDATFWEFDCRFGKNSDEAETLSTSELTTALDKAYEADFAECYIEIIARASYKKRAVSEEEKDEEEA